ncbi:uncharacterized protein BT62DRAFT_920875 [Guyanagaster necrorhizus]|uniref:Uncharacterized protein n=1 Tax=Guyanagaster necrorhizus TaxID=856835 RepID=A0A9P7VR44_9AGAR|nr:uncharacterized protein BT62DRAFT_920875 [Guyanagaster necrorhizus MCA 3950]KAG7445133.1 hypothetical protein BT62DRAFT_920875 [Guyanagaster necrorhizus MCA 3950]
MSLLTNFLTVSILRLKSPSSDPERGLKAWANQVLSKRRENPTSILYASQPPTPTPLMNWWKKRRLSLASSGEVSLMSTIDNWLELANQQKGALLQELRNTESGPQIQNEMKILKTTSISQIIGTSQRIIRIEVLMVDQLKKEEQALEGSYLEANSY